MTDFHPHNESNHSGSALDGGYWTPVSHDEIETEKFNRRAHISVYREDMEETELVPIDCYLRNTTKKRQSVLTVALICAVWVAVIAAVYIGVTS